MYKLLIAALLVSATVFSACFVTGLIKNSNICLQGVVVSGAVFIVLFVTVFNLKTKNKLLKKYKMDQENNQKNNTLHTADRKSNIGYWHDEVAIWAIIGNIITVLVTAGLFYFTRSAWCFLLLLTLYSIKHKAKGV